MVFLLYKETFPLFLVEQVFHIKSVNVLVEARFGSLCLIIGVLGDAELSDEDRTLITLTIFYEDFDSMPVNDFQDAVEYMFWFLNGGAENKKHGKKPRLMDWGQDFPLIVSPVNKVMGFEIRAVYYLHWWTFLAADQEIGDCLFAQVVSIRKKRMMGKKLDKADSQFYRENHDLVDFKRKETDAERGILEEWT